MESIYKFTLTLTGCALTHKYVKHKDQCVLHDDCHYLLSVDSGLLIHFQLLYHLYIIRNDIVNDKIYNIVCLL